MELPLKRVVLTFGFISGGLLSLMMVVSMFFVDQIGFDRSEVLGYTTMVLAFLLVFFGIKSYRDNIAAGSVTFGKAFAVGLLIALVTSACYVATWEVIYYAVFPDFADKYAAHAIEKARTSGASAAQIAEQTRQMAQFKEAYKNPLINVGYTFIEVFPVGLVMTLVSAGILRRRSPGAASGSAAAAGA
jgi:hypothetical protein